eukprot:07681.XXX_342334_341563_1 [CDS] Oithona nana genome sequencing.
MRIRSHNNMVLRLIFNFAFLLHLVYSAPLELTNSLLENQKVEKNHGGSWLQQLLLIDTRTPPKAPPTNLATRPQLALVPVADHEQPFVMFWYPVHPQHPIDYWLY